MGEIFKIFALSFSMFVISYICGNIPLIINFSPKKLEMLTIFGSGILIGTALGIIIPEGLQALIPSETAYPHNNFNDFAYVGPSLIGGFLFMLFTDMIMILLQKYSSNTSHTHSKITTTIGLVIHAAADGLALGAAASTERVDVEIVVFIAIMVHKGPAAFTLTTFLVQGGLERKRIRKHLLIFSLAAPVTAILTFMTLLLAQTDDDPRYSLYNPPKSLDGLSSLFNSTDATQLGPKTISNHSLASALAMLFSGGTFLYVAALHVLPEVGFNQHHHHTHTKGHRQKSYRNSIRGINPPSPTPDEKSCRKILLAETGLELTPSLECPDQRLLLDGDRDLNDDTNDGSTNNNNNNHDGKNSVPYTYSKSRQTADFTKLSAVKKYVLLALGLIIPLLMTLSEGISSSNLSPDGTKLHGSHIH